MKFKKYIIILGVSLAVLSGCSDSFLDREPDGATLSQNQYESIADALDAHVYGLYSMMIEVADHDLFGQKSIDLKTDILSGDVAMKDISYGWFVSAARMQSSLSTNSDNAYIWSYYYPIIKNCNLIIDATRLTTIPETHEDSVTAYYAGQALAMRGYTYYILGNLYGLRYQEGSAAPIVPIYTEDSDPTTARPLSTLAEVYAQAEKDLLRAVDYLDGQKRASKTNIDVDVARGMLAYLYLQRGDGQDYTNAIDLVDEIINGNNYTILPLNDLLTNGFNSVKSTNWMWGFDITTETTGSLASFWGHVDIHTYSYAWAGAYKVMDDGLYATIPLTDMRRQWFDSQLRPDKKFFDPARGTTADEIDRLWTNDIVFMRIEEMYLIGAEAAYRNNDYPTAQRFLEPLVEQRDPVVAPTIAAMTTELRDYIKLNWRVETWCEGRGLLTFRRYGDSMTRGNNHYYYKGEVIAPDYYKMVFELPTSESNRNPNL